MSTVNRVIAAVSVCFVAGLLAWQPTKNFFLEDSCLDGGGKWASNGGYCIHRQCAEDGTCKPGYNNNVICSTLGLPIDQDELYFNLGMPAHQEGDTFMFAPGGGGNPIRATIVDHVVTELSCGR